MLARVVVFAAAVVVVGAFVVVLVVISGGSSRLPRLRRLTNIQTTSWRLSAQSIIQSPQLEVPCGFSAGMAI